MPNVDIADATVSRLQAIAVPLTDTFDTVVNRLLDHWDATTSSQPRLLKPGEPIRTLGDGVTMEFDPANPPNLSFTVFLQVKIEGATLVKAHHYWNYLLHAVIRAAHSKGKDAKAIHQMLFVNAELGQKEDNGYKFLSDVGISVQGQDSNTAFRQIQQLAAANDIDFELHFAWQNSEKAAYPGQRGYFHQA